MVNYLANNYLIKNEEECMGYFVDEDKYICHTSSTGIKVIVLKYLR